MESIKTPSKKSQGFFSSMFASSSTETVKHEEDPPSASSPNKSQRFFSSVLPNNGLFSELSFKLEAAINLGLEALDSDSTSVSGETSKKGSPETRSRSSSNKNMPLSKSQEIASQMGPKQKKKMRRKDRSVYGQPEITASLAKNKIFHESSLESLETLDSDNQSIGNKSSISGGRDYKAKHDPFYVFRRHSDSAAIVSESSDACGQSTSLESSDNESIPEGRPLCRSISGSSWTSSISYDSQPEENSKDFIKKFVNKIFDNSPISYDEKSKFGEVCQQEMGRLWFARCINAQRVHNKQVSETIFYSLIQFFAIVLFECAEADDFSPAKTLMNMCFTYFHEVTRDGTSKKEYLYMYLKDQHIWHSLRFWNAAFFDAVQCERAHRSIPTRQDINQFTVEEMKDEQRFQENITFGQLGTFTYNMFLFGLSQEFCFEFLRKQSAIASLSQEHLDLLRDNIKRTYTSEV